MAELQIGDTPLTEGVNLYDASQEPQLPEPEGDTPVKGEVHLFENYQRSAVPTAGELRKLGYAGVDDSLGDDELVYNVQGDTPLPQGQVNLYEEHPEYPGGPTPEEPTLSVVEPEAPTAISDPSSEENAAGTEEERSEAEAEADALRDQTDPVFTAGQQAAANAEPRSANPYDGRSKEGKTWARGYTSAAGPAS